MKMMNYSDWEWLYVAGSPMIRASYDKYLVIITAAGDNFMGRFMIVNKYSSPVYVAESWYRILGVLEAHILEHDRLRPRNRLISWGELGQEFLSHEFWKEYFNRNQDYLDALRFSPLSNLIKDPNPVEDPMFKWEVDDYEPPLDSVPPWWLSPDLSAYAPWKISTWDTPRRPRNVDEFLASLGLK